MSWEWLPGFTGGNGPILKLYASEGDFAGSVFIAGAFDNYPAIIAWHHEKGIANITGLGGTRTHTFPARWLCSTELVLSGDHKIEGLITSVSQVSFAYEHVPVMAPSVIHEPVVYQRDYTFVILLACVMVGILLGLGVAVGCVTKLIKQRGESRFAACAVRTRSSSFFTCIESVNDRDYETAPDVMMLMVT